MEHGGSSELVLNKQYRGITDSNCLLWCHGTEGLEHRKVRKFRYPLWKYARVSHRVISCVCLHCNMQFYGDLAADVPLNIPVLRRDSYFSEHIPVTIHGRTLGLRGEIIRPFRRVTQAMLTDETRLFIELVQ
jgi:hypothetical protein